MLGRPLVGVCPAAPSPLPFAGGQLLPMQASVLMLVAWPLFVIVALPYWVMLTGPVGPFTVLLRAPRETFDTLRPVLDRLLLRTIPGWRARGGVIAKRGFALTTADAWRVCPFATVESAAPETARAPAL